MKQMINSGAKPSYVTPPVSSKFGTVYEFLVEKFSKIPKEIWTERIKSGKVHFDNKNPI